ncbi:glycoside hydrolase family 19 protein [Elizabethkingia anophelis]|uniref:glycoside hydrolase family 19 protein n=1 Tax=Elizabethkingia anophelis TaxID=1117645 RepID=UPI00398897B8
MTKLELRNKLQKIGANMSNVPEDLFEQMEKYGLKTDEDKFRFLANCLNETGGFKVFKENLFYTTPSRLVAVFPSAFRSKYNPNVYLRDSVKLANLVYDDRKFPKGLGNIYDGDGSKFIGRGAIQTTGRNNYTQLSKDTGIDFISHPEWLERPPYNFISALYYWKKHNLSAKPSLLATRQVIAGNYTNNPFGFKEVQNWYNKLKSA